MGLVNALLVRYAAGYEWVEDDDSIDTYGRREGYLTLGSIESSAEATRIARAILVDKASPATSITAGLEPASSADEPYVAFEVGDYVNAPDEFGEPTSLRVVGLTVGEDAEGNPTFTPELDSLADVREQQLNRWLKRMSNGTLGGSVESASPAPDVGLGPEVFDPDTGFASPDTTDRGLRELPPFSCYTPWDSLVNLPSGIYSPPIALKITSFLMTIAEPCDDDVTIEVDVRVNGSVVQTLTMTDTRQDVDADIDLGPTDELELILTQGQECEDAYGLVVQPRYT